uniref:DNA-binding protein D-ETS-4 n=1 Tax=Ascaris suum TaxID=6253 RepID=F1LGW8_ASCSU
MNDGNSTDGIGVEGRSMSAPHFPRHSGTVHLWHFIRELLDHPKQYSSCVRWVDREEGTFKIESSHHLARFWGQRKNRAQMNYDKLSRSLFDNTTRKESFRNRRRSSASSISFSLPIIYLDISSIV